MKDKKAKKQFHENTIGKIIRMFLMFMPLLAIGVTCGYAIFNKNAYLSSSGNIEVESTTYINNLNYNELPTGEQITYYCNGQQSNLTTSNSGWFTFKTTSLNLSATAYQFRFRYGTNPQDIQIHYTNNTYDTIPLQEFTFTLENVTNSDNGLIGCTNVYFITYTNTETLDNVFYYTIDKVEQNQLFNWSKNSLIYTGLQNTCQALDITNTFIPMILSYWLIISVIYYLYDIILIILNVFHRKIHQLEESI